jgi:hypothetical protein
MLSTGLLSDGPKEYSDTFSRRWLVTSYEAGDVVLHNPFAIHASTINFDPDNVIRVGTDLRFVDSSKPWDKVGDISWSCNTGLTDIALGSRLPVQRRSVGGGMVLLSRNPKSVEGAVDKGTWWSTP